MTSKLDASPLAIIDSSVCSLTCRNSASGMPSSTVRMIEMPPSVINTDSSFGGEMASDALSSMTSGSLPLMVAWTTPARGIENGTNTTLIVPGMPSTNGGTTTRCIPSGTPSTEISMSLSSSLIPVFTSDRNTCTSSLDSDGRFAAMVEIPTFDSALDPIA